MKPAVGESTRPTRSSPCCRPSSAANSAEETTRPGRRRGSGHADHMLAWTHGAAGQPHPHPAQRPRASGSVWVPVFQAVRVAVPSAPLCPPGAKAAPATCEHVPAAADEPPLADAGGRSGVASSRGLPAPPTRRTAGWASISPGLPHQECMSTEAAGRPQQAQHSRNHVKWTQEARRASAADLVVPGHQPAWAATAGAGAPHAQAPSRGDEVAAACVG